MLIPTVPKSMKHGLQSVRRETATVLMRYPSMFLSKEYNWPEQCHKERLSCPDMNEALGLNLTPNGFAPQAICEDSLARLISNIDKPETERAAA